MKKTLMLLAVMVFAVGLSAQEQGENVLTWKWDNGLHFGTSDGTFSMKFGGLVQNDWAFFDADDALKSAANFDNGVEFRRARLHVAGKLYKNIKFMAEYDMAGGDADFKDVWVCLTKVPGVGNVLVGHDKEPFSLGTMTSPRHRTFMEKGLPADTFSPARNTGILVFNHAMEKKLTWSAGIFRTSDSYGDYNANTFADRHDDYNLTGRLTFLPVCKEAGKQLVHVGLGLSYRKPEGGALAITAQPESNIAPVLATTGAMADADELILVGIEAAGVYNQFHAQAEYIMAMIDSEAQDDPDFSGWYLQGGWFVTGETRPYVAEKGVFGRVIPKEDFNMDASTWGAFELALRVSGLDLDDGNVTGGEMMNIGLGANWYLNPNTKFSLNYIHTEAERGALYDDAADILMARFQLDF